MTDYLPLWAENLAVFDTETTGVDTSSARIVSSTIALIGGSGEVKERYDWLIDPGIEIPEGAARTVLAKPRCYESRPQMTIPPQARSRSSTRSSATLTFGSCVTDWGSRRPRRPVEFPQARR